MIYISIVGMRDLGTNDGRSCMPKAEEIVEMLSSGFLGALVTEESVT
jgi:hypothetical protein